MDLTIEKIYKYSRLLMVCKEELSFLCSRNTWLSRKNWNSNIQLLKDLYYEWQRIDEESAEEYAGSLREFSAEIDDAVLAADCLEEKIIPQLYSFLSTFAMPDVICTEYTLKKSRSGFYTIFNKKTAEYSKNDPLWEAKLCVDSYYNVNKQKCYILGAELGYFAYSVYKKYYGAIEIYIYDHSKENIENAYKYGVLDWIEEKNLHIEINENNDELFSTFITAEENSDNVFYYISPHFISFSTGNLASMAKDLSENFDLLRNYKDLYTINYLQNKKLVSYGFEYIKEKYKDIADNCIVVAAGPSVNEKINYLKQKKGECCIIAVTTILRKLVSNGIIPDVAVIIDPTDGTYKHIDNILNETEHIPLVFESQSYWKVTRDYKGKKIRILGSDSEQVKKEASETGDAIWETGPTVTCFAIEIAVRLGARKIELVGCDLAYPEGKSYADSLTSDVKSSEYTASVDGGMVQTSLTFKTFKAAIEKQIEKDYSVQFYNLSNHGAFINGCFAGNWWENNNDFLVYLDMLKVEDKLTWEEKYYLLWQTIYKYLKMECNAEGFWKKVADNLSAIRDAFGFNLISPERIITRPDFIVLLTSKFSMFDDDLSQKILQDAYTLTHRQGKTVMIINTCEYLGGKMVPVCDRYREAYPVELEGKEFVYYLGDKYAYYQLPEKMPNPEYANSLIQYFSNSAPELVINYDEISLMADAFKKVSKVEHR